MNSLSQEASDLSTSARAGEREATWRHSDESPDHPALVADHARQGLVCSVEHQRAQACAIRSNSPLWLGSMDCDVHRIVPKRQRQDVQEFTSSARIGIGNGFVYHAPIMLTATNFPRVLGIPFSVLGQTPIKAAPRSPEIRFYSKRIGVFGDYGVVS